MGMTDFQKRIKYKGSSKKLFKQVADDYNFGDYLSSKEISLGYEDYNVVLDTSTGKYFVKFFADFRSKEDCQRYVDTMLVVLKAGIKHPRLLQSNQGYLHELTLEEETVWLCVLEFIEGKSFYELGEQPTQKELLFLAEQAALINQIDLKPEPVYDSWACVNFVKEFNKKKQYLEKDDLKMIEPLAKKIAGFDLHSLPFAFVHGDIIKTNVMRDANGEIYVLDFSVSNWYPRIQELAVLFCDLFYNEDNPSNFPELFKKGIATYQKIQLLTPKELDILPTYTQVAHAMHIVCPTYEREVNNNHTKENDRWLELGQRGLKYSLELWGV